MRWRKSLEVARLKSQLPEGESTFQAGNKLSSKLDGNCAARAPERKELRGLGDEELVTSPDINKLLNDFDELNPKWLNSVKDVVDSEDLPLNVYCETLVQNKILRVIKKNHVTKYLEMLAETAELKDDRKKFYERFVKCMKLGIRENSVDDVETAELLRFNTFKPGDEQISFEEYVDRMKEGQNDIFCITGESIATVSSRKKGQGEREKGERGKREEQEEEKKEIGEETKKEKRKEVQEETDKKVEKDVMDWTKVTRSKKQRRKTVQIFVKVNGSKATPVEVSLTDDKVEDVVKQIQKNEDAYVTMQGKVLRTSEGLKSCGVTDGCTIQVTSRIREGGRYKDKKSKGEKKQVAQLDDGICSMACEQLRWMTESVNMLSRRMKTSVVLRRRWKR